jgi:predicted nucleic acid-binding protein
VILVDTSAWVEYLRATGGAADERLSRALKDGEELATTGMVLLELLAGGRDEQHAEQLRRLLAGCRFLAVEEPMDGEAAAALYPLCRTRGTTIRRLVDCLVAAVGIRTQMPLLHQDADFEAIAQHASLLSAS